MKTIRNLIIKYKELITYVLFGLCTTVVNFVVFKLSNMLLGVELYLVSNVFAWIAAISFSYVTNKLWVFKSKSWKSSVIAKEVSAFFGARVFSFIIEEAGLFALVDLAHFNEISINILSVEIGGQMIAKMIIGVIVVVLNYVFSKLVIFRKKI